MDIETQEDVCSENDEENRTYRDFCDKLCIERFYKLYLKSKTHTKNIFKTEQ